VRVKGVARSSVNNKHVNARSCQCALVACMHLPLVSICSKCGKCGSMSRRQMCTTLQQVWQVWQYVTTADVHHSAASVASVAVCHDGRCAPLCSKCGKCGSMSRRQMCTALQQECTPCTTSAASVAVCHDGRCAPLCSKSVHHARCSGTHHAYALHATGCVQHASVHACTIRMQRMQ
jgi:hypothetical protein